MLSPITLPPLWHLLMSFFKLQPATELIPTHATIFTKNQTDIYSYHIPVKNQLQ